MRWNLLKRAWKLAESAFGGKRVFVPSPDSLSSKGELPVFDLDSPGAPIGVVSYSIKPSGGTARVVMRIGDKTDDFLLPRLHSTAFRVKKEPRMAMASGMVKVAKPSLKKRFEKYDRVRIVDVASMDYMECGYVMEMATKGEKRYCLVLVDGSSKPLWFDQDLLDPDMAGTTPQERASLEKKQP